MGFSRCANCLDASHAETVFHPHAAALKGTHQRVLQLKIPPPGTPQRASSTPQREIYSSCSSCFHFMGLSAHIQIHPYAAAPKRDAPACPVVEQPQKCTPTCVVHAPAWDPACCSIIQSNIFFLSLTFSFSSGCSSYPLLTNPPKTYLYKKKILHTHLPNIHAFLTTIHLSLINFSLLTLPPIPNSPF